jgi:hypothetical protein
MLTEELTGMFFIVSRGSERGGGRGKECERKAKGMGRRIWKRRRR